jgi:hypothetical protein
MSGPTLALTPGQQAALAKIACAVARPGGVALLCGPQGVGISTVLDHVAACGRLAPRIVERQDFEAWEACLATGRDDLPDVVLADEAHRAGDGGLFRLLAACRRRRPESSLVLAGEGRLLTLTARDVRVEQAVHLRASLRPCTASESHDLLAPRLAANALTATLDAAAAIHEIGGGIPAAMLRLADLAAVVAASRTDGMLTVHDVEAVHRRLSPQAA